MTFMRYLTRSRFSMGCITRARISMGCITIGRNTRARKYTPILNTDKLNTDIQNTDYIKH